MTKLFNVALTPFAGSKYRFRIIFAYLRDNETDKQHFG